MKTKNELSELSKLVMDFDEVKQFSAYIERMARVRNENESEDYSNIKSAFICIIGENKHLKEQVFRIKSTESDMLAEVILEIKKIKKFIKKLRIF